MRVRKVLDSMHPSTRSALRRLIPVGDAPELETSRYPHALLSFFPKPHQYACIGFVAESILRLPIDSIQLEVLEPAAKEALGRFGLPWSDGFEKVLKSKTTVPFLELLKKTRATLDMHIRGELQGETVVHGQNVVGHPDARTTTQIFEIKVTYDLKKNWTSFLCQSHAYAALDETVQDVYLVLPLQSTVLQFDVRSWAKRREFCRRLEDAAGKVAAPVAAAPAVQDTITILSKMSEDKMLATLMSLDPTSAMALATSILQQSQSQPQQKGMDILRSYNIGSHMPKFPTLLKTVQELPPSSPSQIFLGAPQNSKLSLKEADIHAAAHFIAEKRLDVYIHAPYIINLAEPELPDDWAVKLLQKNLEVGAALGCHGVVVHVGKAKTTDRAVATEHMRANLIRVLESATEECPLLLETPAGQGTELLKGQEEFIHFVESFASNKLRVCLDTCHVFACGHAPLAFVDALTVSPGLLRLIHFNDSMDICGACKDRHAFVGTGKIGTDVLEAVAMRAVCHGIPMVVE